RQVPLRPPLRGGPMRLGLLLLLCASASAPAFAPAPFSKAARKGPVTDLQRLQGTWAVVGRSHSGGQLDRARYANNRVVIKGDRTSYPRKGVVLTEGAIHLNPAATPPRLTMKRVGGRVKGEVTLNAIYQLTGNRFQILHGDSDQPAPASFQGPSQGFWL